MKKVTPTIEEQINSTIALAMKVAHDEQKDIIESTIKQTVNGKIDSFRADQKLVNDAQNQALEEIKKSVKNVIDLYEGSGKFFRTVKNMSAWVLTVTSGAIAMWAFIKFVILSAID
jgi:actin-like ATPase involved in cell morphogenesis